MIFHRKPLKESGESTPEAIPWGVPPSCIHRLTLENTAPGNGDSTHTEKSSGVAFVLSFTCRHFVSALHHRQTLCFFSKIDINMEHLAPLGSCMNLTSLISQGDDKPRPNANMSSLSMSASL